MDMSFEVSAPVPVTVPAAAGASAASPPGSLPQAGALENSTTAKEQAAAIAASGGEADAPPVGVFSLQTSAGSLESFGSLVGSFGSGSLGSGSLEARGALPSLPSLSHAGGSGGFSSSLAALLSQFGSNSAAATSTAVPSLASSIPARLPEAALAASEGTREPGRASATGATGGAAEAQDTRVVKVEATSFPAPGSSGLASQGKQGSSPTGSNQRPVTGLSRQLSAIAEQDRLQWALEEKPSVNSLSNPPVSNPPGGKAASNSTAPGAASAGQAAKLRSGPGRQEERAEAAEEKEGGVRGMDQEAAEDKGAQAGAQAAVTPGPSVGLNRMTSADLGLAKQSSLQSADFGAVSDFTLFPGTGSGSLRGLVSSGSGAGGLFRGESLIGALNPPLLRAESYEFSFFGPFGSASLEDAVRPPQAREGAGEDAQHKLMLLQQQHQLLQQHQMLQQQQQQQQQQRQGAEGAHSQQDKQEQGQDGRNGVAAGPGHAQGQKQGGVSPKQGERGVLSLGQDAGEAPGASGAKGVPRGILQKEGQGAEEEEACNMLPSAGLSITTERPGSPLLALGMRTASPKLSIGASGAGTGQTSGAHDQGAVPGSPQEALKKLLQEHRRQQGAKEEDGDASLLALMQAQQRGGDAGAAAARRAPSPQAPSQRVQQGAPALGAEGLIERADSGTIDAIVRSTQRPGVGAAGVPEGVPGGVPGGGQQAGSQGQSFSGASGDASGAPGTIQVRPGGLLEELRSAGVSMGEEKFAAAIGSLPMAAELLQTGSQAGGSKAAAGLSALQRMRSPSPNVSGGPAARDGATDIKPLLPVASRLPAPSSSGAPPAGPGQAGSTGSARRPFVSPPPSPPRALAGAGAGAEAEGARGLDAAARLHQLEQQQLLELLPLLSQQMQVQQQIQQGQQPHAQGQQQQQQQQQLASQLLSSQLRQQGLPGIGQAPGTQGQAGDDIQRQSQQAQREQLLLLLQQHQQQQAKRGGVVPGREQRLQAIPGLGPALAAMQGLGDAMGTPAAAAAAGVLGAAARQQPTLNLLPNGLSPAPGQGGNPPPNQMPQSTPPHSPGRASQLGAGALKGDSASLLELLGRGYLGEVDAQKGIASAGGGPGGLNLSGAQLAAMAKGAMGTGAIVDAGWASGAQQALHLLQQQQEKERLLKHFPGLLLQQQGQGGAGLGMGAGAAQQLNMLLQQQMRGEQQKQKADVQQQLLLLHQLQQQQQQQLGALGVPHADALNLAQDQQQGSLHSRGISSGDGDTQQGPQKRRRKAQQDHDGAPPQAGAASEQGGGTPQGTVGARGLLSQKAQREATPPPGRAAQRGAARPGAAVKQEQGGVDTPLSRVPVDPARIRESLGLPRQGPAATRAAAALLASSLKEAESSGAEEEEEEEEVEKVPGKPGPRRKRGPVTKPCAAARKRRDCISRHIKTLQGMIPAAPKSDAATVLAETITYVAHLLDENEALRQALSQRGQGGAHLDADGKGSALGGGGAEEGARRGSDSLEGAALGGDPAVVTQGPDAVTHSGAPGGA